MRGHDDSILSLKAICTPLLDFFSHSAGFYSCSHLCTRPAAATFPFLTFVIHTPPTPAFSTNILLRNTRSYLCSILLLRLGFLLPRRNHNPPTKKNIHTNTHIRLSALPPSLPQAAAAEPGRARLGSSRSGNSSSRSSTTRLLALSSSSPSSSTLSCPPTAAAAAAAAATAST